MRKLKTTIALLTCIVTFLIAVSANASDKTGMNFRQDRVVVELDNEMDMNTFFQHFPYNPNKNYTFVIVDKDLLRIKCPSCGSNSYRGVTEYSFYTTFMHMCPYNITTLTDDYVSVYRKYTYSKCDVCGYKTSKVFTGTTKYFINCITGATFWAIDGRTMAGGYDIHECKSTWN